MRLCLFVALAGSLILGNLSAQSNLVRFQSGDRIFSENINSLVQQESQLSGETVNSMHYRWMQFKSPLSQGVKVEMENTGLEFIQYLPTNTYLVAIPAGWSTDQLLAFPVHSLQILGTKEKMNLALWEGDFPDHALIGDEIQLAVQLMPHATIGMVENALTLWNGQSLASYPGDLFMQVQLPLDKMYALASHPAVMFVEAIGEEGTPEDYWGRVMVRSNLLMAPTVNGRNYDGSGINIQVRDDGYVGPHIDFQGRLNLNYVPFGGGSHGDRVAGSAAGANNLNPLYGGTAPGANIFVTDYDNDFLDVTLALHTEEDVRITNSSYSDGCNGGYTARSQRVDQQLFNNRYYMHVFSAGNNGTSNCGYGAGDDWGNVTGGHKIGKNCIAVGSANANGGLVASSSRGPAADGRLKPDIVGHGDDVWATLANNTYEETGGTSFSAPMVAGLMAQLTQAYESVNPGKKADAALIKAIMLNSTYEMDNFGPDYKTGWGMANGDRAAELIENGQHLEQTLFHADVQTHPITVPAGVKELRVMLYWPDPPAATFSSQSLINDLDLELVDPTDVVHQPLVLDPTPNPANLNSPAVPGRDSLNNMEQVRILNPAAGSYTASIEGFNVPEGPQKYYIVYGFIMDGVKLTHPVGGETFVPGEEQIIRWDASGMTPADGNFSLEYSPNNGASWLPINTNVSASQRRFDWVVPAGLSTGQALVRISRNGFSDQSTHPFTILGVPQNLQVIQVCPDYTRIDWDQVPNALGYDIFILGKKYMDSIGSTDLLTTAYDVPVDASSDEWFAVRAISQDSTVGRRTVAILRPPGLVSCTIGLDALPLELIRPVYHTFPGCDSTKTQLGVRFTNGGVAPITDLVVSYQVGQGPIITENLNGVLPQNGQVSYNFLNLINLPGPGTYPIKVWSELPGDQIPGNDTLSFEIEMLPGAVSQLPILEDFESFTLCETTPSCGDIVCPMSDQWINLTNGSADDIDWRIHTGATPSESTGPFGDKKPGLVSGKYAYLEASGACNEATATLWSQCIDLTGAQLPELSLWYHMYGQEMGSLSVDVFSNGNWTSNLININGNRGDLWRKVTATLAIYSGKTILIQIRGRTGSGFTSDMAIDNILIYDRAKAPIVDFVSDRRQVCLDADVQFTDFTENSPNSWKWEIFPNTYSFQNGTDASSQNPAIRFHALGTYTVKLVAGNINGMDSLIQSQYIDVVEGQEPNWTQDFEGSNWPPSNWSVVNPDGLTSWSQAMVTGIDGMSTHAAFVNNYDYDGSGSRDNLLSMHTDLTASDQVQLRFDLAYAPRSASRYERLEVQISTDCGESFSQTIYAEESGDLGTVQAQYDSWAPEQGSDWRTETIDLSAFVGQQIQIRFVNVNGHGNGLYIDNIQLEELGTAKPNAHLSYEPSPICENGSATFSDQSSGMGISSYSWNFGPNATPATATGPGPHMVDFSGSGTVTASLTISDGTNSDSVIYAMYLEPLPNPDFSHVTQGAVVGFSNLTPNATSYEWHFGDGTTSTSANPAHTYSSNGSYTVTLIATNDCGTDSISQTIDMTTVSIEEHLLSGIRLYPNPNSGYFELEFQTPDFKEYDLLVTDMRGRKVMSESIYPVGGLFQHSMNLSMLPEGIYFLQVSHAPYSQTLKVIIKH